MRAGLLLLLAAGNAYADDGVVVAARAQASAAEQLAASQKYEDAAVGFRAAYRLDPQPAYLCNVGVAYHRAKLLPQAMIYLSDCLRLGRTLDPTIVGLARRVLADAQRTLGAVDFAPVTIDVKPEGTSIAISTFDPDETFVGSHVVWLPFGKHTVSATAAGYEPALVAFEVKTRTERELRVELQRVAPVATSPVVVTPKAPRRLVTTTRSKIPPIVATAMTLAVAGAALGIYGHASGIVDSAAAATIDRDEYDRRIDRAHTWQHASWALAGVAGAGAIVSGILWVRSMGTTTIDVAPTAEGGAVTLSGSW
jgi:hypothetical protein